LSLPSMWIKSSTSLPDDSYTVPQKFLVE
jgi:hypothetical protein